MIINATFTITSNPVIIIRSEIRTVKKFFFYKVNVTISKSRNASVKSESTPMQWPSLLIHHQFKHLYHDYSTIMLSFKCSPVVIHHQSPPGGAKRPAAMCSSLPRWVLSQNERWSSGNDYFDQSIAAIIIVVYYHHDIHSNVTMAKGIFRKKSCCCDDLQFSS